MPEDTQHAEDNQDVALCFFKEGQRALSVSAEHSVGPQKAEPERLLRMTDCKHMCNRCVPQTSFTEDHNFACYQKQFVKQKAQIVIFWQRDQTHKTDKINELRLRQMLSHVACVSEKEMQHTNYSSVSRNNPQYHQVAVVCISHSIKETRRLQICKLFLW